MKAVAIAFLLIALSIPSMAVQIPQSDDGYYEIAGPVSNFTQWAVAGGANSIGFNTNNTALTGNVWMSGALAPDTTATISIPFDYINPISTAILDYGATALSYGSNWGYTKLYITCWGVETPIFAGSADSALASDNYSIGQTPPHPMGWWRGYTDITNLVKGAYHFDLKIETRTGWSGWVYNGGSFLPQCWDDSDFYLSGKQASGSLGGKVILSTFYGDMTTIPLKLDFFQDGQIVRTSTIYPNDSGTFIVEGIAEGRYDLTVSVDGWGFVEADNIVITDGNTIDIGSLTYLPAAVTPIITPDGGSYSSKPSVTMSTQTVNATIRYTLDATEPSNTSAIYYGPFQIASSTILKAKAFRDGYNPSDTKSAIFTVTGIIKGKLNLADFSASVSSVPITVELRKQGGATTTQIIHTDSNGNYTLANVEPGVYDISFKASHWLKRVVSNVSVVIN